MRMRIALGASLVGVFVIALHCGAAPARAQDLNQYRQRLQAVAPLVPAAVSGGKMDDALARRAKEVGMEPARLKLWLDLFLAHGRDGLTHLSPASAAELARQEEGTWRMTYRATGGLRDQQESWMLNEIIELRPGYSRLRSLTLESGIVRSPGGDGKEPLASLGAYGIITQKEVAGEAYGLGKGETAILQTFDFELRGDHYPGVEKPLSGRSEALFVKQSEVYRTVYLKVEYKVGSELVSFLPYDETAVTALSRVNVSTFFSMDTEEVSNKVADRLLVNASLDAIWKAASENPELLDPGVHLRDDPRHLLGDFATVGGAGGPK